MLGAAAIVGGIAAAVVGIPAAEILAPTLIIGGAAVFKRGMDRNSEAEIHADAIRELGASLDTEVTPMVIEIEGQTMELQGSADEQYRNWRLILHQIYSKETGFPSTEPSGEDEANPEQKHEPRSATASGA